MLSAYAQSLLTRYVLLERYPPLHQPHHHLQRLRPSPGGKRFPLAEGPGARDPTGGHKTRQPYLVYFFAAVMNRGPSIHIPVPTNPMAPS